MPTHDAIQPMFVAGRLTRRGPSALTPAIQPMVDRLADVSVTRNGTADVIRLDGPLCSDSGWLWEGIGAITYSRVVAAINASVQERTPTIVLDMQCPGGGAWGMTDLRDAIARARSAGVRVIAYHHDLAASMAYWISCLCDEIVASPTAMVGHIGAMIAAYDDSAAFEEAGVIPAMIASDPEKVVGYPGVPKSDGWRATMQRIVDQNMDAFVADVARARSMDPAAVRGLHAGVFTAQDALSHGLVDSIESPEAFFARVAALPPKARTTPSGPAGQSRATLPERKGSVMEWKDLTAADIKAQRPDLAGQFEADGAKSEQAKAAQPATFAQLKTIFGGDTAGIVASQESGHTEAQAIAAKHEATSKRLADAEAKVTELSAKVADFETKSGARKGEEPVAGTVPANGGGASFADAVKAIAAKENIPRPAAAYKARHLHRELHAAWVDQGCPPIN